MSKSITFSIIFQAQSLNYGEGIGTISELKKVTRGDGNYYSIATRQAITYDIRRLGEEIFGWNLQTVDKSKGTIQFRSDCTIRDSVEMDLFGYMKTKKKTGKKEETESLGADTRSAVARVSNAISLEPYRSDIDYLTSKGLADRIGTNTIPLSVEQHVSFYTYTVTIDLDKVGIDSDIILSNEERAKRVNELLDLVKILNRNIRGRQENLAPLFIIGGMYDIANPFFLGRIKLNINKEKYEINTDILNSVLDITILDCNVKDNTRIGLVSGVFGNEKEVRSCVENVNNIETFFKGLKEEVNNYYGV